MDRRKGGGWDVVPQRKNKNQRKGGGIIVESQTETPKISRKKSRKKKSTRTVKIGNQGHFKGEAARPTPPGWQGHQHSKVKKGNPLRKRKKKRSIQSGKGNRNPSKKHAK